MKTTLLRTAHATAVVAVFPALANAHPGHSAFDFTSGVPHRGHESEFAILLIIAALVTLLLVARSLLGRRD